MADKNVGIKMDENAYALLKLRAKQLGVKIGPMVENLLGSLELRLKNAYEKSEIKDKSNDADRLLVRAILESDRYGWNEKKLLTECGRVKIGLLRDSLDKRGWLPEIQIPKNDNEKK